MATGATIGALRVVLGADTAAFEDGLKGAQSKMASFGASIGKSAAVIGVAVAGAAAALGVAVKGAIDEADKLGKMAQSIGVPVEELSRLKHAADLSGVGIEELGKSVGKLSKAMSEVAGGGTGPAADAFRALGISVTDTDGKLRSSTEVMTDIAARFGKMEDGAGKTALAMAIFGKSGASMIPMLNQGAVALREMMNEADALGIVISERTAKAAEAFNDNLTRLGKVKDGIIIKITEHLLPGLEALSTGLVNVAKNTNFAATVGDTLSSWMVGSAALTMRLSSLYERFTANLLVLRNVIGLVASGELTAAMDAFRAGAEATNLAFVHVNAEVKALYEKFTTVPIGQSMWGGQSPEDAGAKLAAPALIATKKIEDARRDQQRTLGQIFDEEARWIESVRTPAEALLVKQKEIQDAFDRGMMSAETYARNMEKASERAQMTWGQMGSSVTGSMATVANVFGKENKSMAMAGKAFAISQAIINAYLASSKAFATLPPPASYVAAGAALATGLATVANIKSQQIPNFAEGGSIRIGGRGGRDSQFVPFMASPGEQVDVWKPGDGGGDPRSGGTRTIIVEGVDAGKFYSGKAIRELIGKFNEAVRDGARLRVVPA